MGREVKKREERRLEILAASRNLFLTQGYENTTIQDVMTKLNIAKGTAYHYFKSKDALLEAVVKDMVEEYVLGVEKAVNTCKGSALDKMRALIQSGRVGSPEESTLTLLHQPENRGMHVLLLAMTVAQLASLYAKVIIQGCEEKCFTTEHPLECAELLLAGIQFITDRGYYPWNAEDLKRRMLALSTLIEDLLHAPKGSFNFLFEKNSSLEQKGSS